MALLSGRRILIAEDESMIALQLEDLLHDLGCEVIGPATTVREVEEAIAEQELHGALLDVNLRGATVLPALPRLRQRCIPFIITSGYDAQSLFPVEFRTVPRIVKPFSEDEVRKICVAMFSERAANPRALS